MADYISREAAVKVLTSIGVQVSDSRRRAVAKCINEIALLHAADVAPVSRWIPVSERLPENGVSVLGWYKDNPFARFCPEIVSWNGKGWVFVYAQRYVTDVTHWMPLPEPPKMGGGAEDG